jgi:hypothetical protein
MYKNKKRERFDAVIFQPHVLDLLAVHTPGRLDIFMFCFRTKLGYIIVRWKQ